MKTRVAAWRRIGAMLLCLCMLIMSVPAAGAASSDPLDNAVTRLRQGMEERKTEVSVTIQTKEPLVASGAGGIEPLGGEMLSLLAREIYDRAIVHTGKGTQGDYLLWHLSRWGGSSMLEQSGSTITYTFTYTFTYHSNTEQEAAVKTQASAVLNQLALTGKSDYEKIKAIYEYICETVTYDHAHLNDDDYVLKYSAYAALINKTAVCQGYANLFYLLANQAGVDTRIIAGVSNGQPHAWNIVRLDGKYYNVDCTWDAGRTDQAHFLKGSGNFNNHQSEAAYQTAAFTTAYPISRSDYTVSQPEQPSEPEQPTEPEQPSVPAPTEPERPTEPAPTEPVPTEPKPTEPKPTEPAPTEPKPTEPKPTEPKPTEPSPTELEPTDPVPTDPGMTGPAPTDTGTPDTEPSWPADPVQPTQPAEKKSVEEDEKTDPIVYLVFGLIGLSTAGLCVMILLKVKAKKEE